MHAFEFVESSFDTVEELKAARAFLICAWLEDMNWHSEVSELLKRVRSTEYLKSAFKALEANESATTKIDHAARLLNYIFGWGLATAEWSATKGDPLIEELWQIINFKSQL